MSKNTPGNQHSLKCCIYAVNKASNNKAIFKQEEGRDTDETKYCTLNCWVVTPSRGSCTRQIDGPWGAGGMFQKIEAVCTVGGPHLIRLLLCYHTEDLNSCPSDKK